jgi:hypothetical protein
MTDTEAAITLAEPAAQEDELQFTRFDYDDASARWADGEAGRPG